MKLDNVSFTKEGWESFKELKKTEQISKLTQMLSPKDEERAKKLLKNVPHGNIVQRNEPKTEIDNTAGLGKASDNTSGNGQGKGIKESKD